MRRSDSCDDARRIDVHQKHTPADRPSSALVGLGPTLKWPGWGATDAIGGADDVSTFVRQTGRFRG